MPLFDDRKSSKRPIHGYESFPARRARLEHQCLSYLLQPFEERTTNKKNPVLWGGDEKRDTAVYLGAVVVDHPQLDKFTGCPGQLFMCSNVL